VWKEKKANIPGIGFTVMFVHTIVLDLDMTKYVNILNEINGWCGTFYYH